MLCEPIDGGSSLPKLVLIVHEARFDVHDGNGAFGADRRIDKAGGGGGGVHRIRPAAICVKATYDYCATARPVLRGLDLTTVGVQPCEVVEVSMEPSKGCEVFERLFEMLQTSSRGNPKLIHKQNKVKIQRRT